MGEKVYGRDLNKPISPTHPFAQLSCNGRKAIECVGVDGQVSWR